MVGISTLLRGSILANRKGKQGSAINPEEIKRYEVTEVYSHPDAKVDIVLVHGLNGHPRNTWTAKNGVFWPSQLLPTALKSAQARVLTYGYNADVYAFGSGKSPSTDLIHQHAQTLLANLSLERKSEERTYVPIIWVAHSLGGILVKRALELSHDLAGKTFHAVDLFHSLAHMSRVECGLCLASPVS
jgi:alpha-beta hydrolase superfamily lysophospholipase